MTLHDTLLIILLSKAIRFARHHCEFASRRFTRAPPGPVHFFAPLLSFTPVLRPAAQLQSPTSA
eukprot:4938787-Pyramimonas_sp.AAC.1